MGLFKYWNYVGSLADIEDYVKTYENNEWNCEPIPYKADEYGLISNRHKMPVKNFIFSEILFGHNSYSQMEKIAINKLKQQKTSDNIIIYVTGYSASLIAAINAAKNTGYTQVILKHHDKETGLYLCQWVY